MGTTQAKLNQPVIFRCDASISIGTGHVHRCLAVAEHLAGLGIPVVFIVREITPELKLAVREVAELKVLPPSLREADEIDLILGLWPKSVVLDHYSLGTAWQEKIASQVKLVAFDDLADRPLAAEFVVNANFGASASQYAGKILPSAQLVLGPAHTILKKSVIRLQKSPPPKKPDQAFCFFGGTDPTNESAKLVSALSAAKPCRLKFIISLGQNSPDRHNLFGKRGPNFETRCEPARFHQDLAESAIFLGSGGTITAERLFLGLPGFVVAVASNQEAIAERIAAEGIQRYLGPYGAVNYEVVIRQMEEIAETDLSAQAELGRRVVRQMSEEEMRRIFL